MADISKLPVPVTEIWDWQLRGSCRGMNSDLFFHPERERGPARANREARAKRVCRRCPVLQQCREHALAVHEPYGVWGGLSAAERDEQIRAGAVQSVTSEVDLSHGHHMHSAPGVAPTRDSAHVAGTEPAHAAR